MSLASESYIIITKEPYSSFWYVIQLYQAIKIMLISYSLFWNKLHPVKLKKKQKH